MNSRLPIALTGLAVLPLVPATAAAQTPGPVPTSARVQQVGSQLRWTTTFRSAPDFAAGDRVCLRLKYGKRATPRAAVCVEGSPAALRYAQLDGDGGEIAGAPLRGTVDASRPRTLRATFALAGAGLAQRAFSWQVVATGPSGGGGELRAVTARTVTPPTARPTGCRPSGAAQVRSAPGHAKTVALTFDDGPSPYTPAILSILEREHVPATFFVIGSQVHGRESLLRRMLADGDAIGNHTWDHANMSGGGRLDEITRTQSAVHAATGYTPCLLRPPYGATSSALVGELHAHGLASVLWNVDPTDWSTPGAGAIVSRVLAQTHGGSIVLMHDGGGNRSQTIAALPAIIHSLAARGYRFATVPGLLGYETAAATAKALPATTAS